MAVPLQAFWEGGCCLSCPRMEEPETSAADSTSTGLTLNMGRGPKAVCEGHIRTVSSEVVPNSSSLPLLACPGLGEGRVKLQVSAKQVLSEKASQATQMLASPLPPHLSISLICPGQDQGISPPRADKDQSWRQTEVGADCAQGSGRPWPWRPGCGVASVAAGQRRGGVVWYTMGLDPLRASPVPGCLIPWRPPEEPHFCSMHVTSCWVSTPLESRAHVTGHGSSARSKYPLGTDI